MKLGDSMAPIEACSAWNEVCPRKTRPPKIGNVPRHVAVDEEPPGCSTTTLLGRFGESSKSSKLMIHRSTSCQIEHGRLFRGSSPSDENLQKSASVINNEKCSESTSSTENLLLVDNTLNVTSLLLNKLSMTSGVAENRLDVLIKHPTVRLSRSNVMQNLDDDLNDNDDNQTVSWENKVPEEIFEIRRDSAVYIDEEVASNSRSGKAPMVNPQEDINEDGISRLSGVVLARRESSGYFSNLGTFDEDRWSTMDLASQREQQLAAPDSHERRKSTKTNILLPNYNHQQLLLSTSLTNCEDTKRATNLICSTSNVDDTSKYTSPNDNATSSIMVRNEVLDVDEQVSLQGECQKSLIHVPSVVSEINEIDHYLRNEVSKISMEATRNNGTSFEGTNHSNSDKKVGNIMSMNIDIEYLSELDSIAKTGILLTTSPRALKAQRSRTIIHQYSSPNLTNAELERIVEKPYSEVMHGYNARLENERNGQPETLKLKSEDINVDVVTAMPGTSTNDHCIIEAKADSQTCVPRSIKVYQLLSTQSEDRGDDESRLFDRRISLQITRENEDEMSYGNPTAFAIKQKSVSTIEDKKLIHADSVPIIKIPSGNVMDAACLEAPKNLDDTFSRMRKLSTSSELRISASDRINIVDNLTCGGSKAGIRPIYPYYPYSPYGSPQSSPRTTRRRPLRESRRVSIDSRQGALQLNQYKLLNNIGQGSYGIVKLAYNEEDETHYAMKILSKKKLMKKAGIFGRIAPGRKGISNPLAKVYREIALLKKLDHPNVVKLVEVLDDPDEDNLYLVFELVEKGEVMQLPADEPLDEETARKHFRDVVMGVEYLHYQRIVHRDIKPSNLLVDSDGRVKIADLGVSAELRASGELLSGFAGTPAFAAPETTTPGAEYSGTPCDVWSMGVTLYSLVMGKVPWDGAGSIIGVQSAVRSEQLRFPEEPRIRENLRDLITRMVAKDPMKRITLAEIKENPWITNNGAEPLPNEVDNCCLPITVTDEEVARVVTRVPKLDTLILIKTMLKQHSFQNPFLPRRIVRSSRDVGMSPSSIKHQLSTDNTGSSAESLVNDKAIRNKTEQFHTAGRSNSAPDSYEWQTNGRQVSSDSQLPPVTESSSLEAEVGKR